MARASVSDPTQSSFASTWWSNPASTSRPPLVARARARLARPPPLSSRHHVPPTKRRRVRSARHIHAHHATHGDAPSSLDAAHAHHDAKSPQVSTSPTRSNAQSIAMRVRTLKSQIDRDDARRKHRRLVEHPLTTSTRMSPCAHPIGVALSRHHHHHHHQSSFAHNGMRTVATFLFVCHSLGDPSHHHHHHHHHHSTTRDDARCVAHTRSYRLRSISRWCATSSSSRDRRCRPTPQPCAWT